MVNEWLANLKAGDEVAIDSGFNGYELLKVDRLTSTQILCGTRRFRRDSGRMVGGSGYSVPYLKEVTPSVRERIERNRILTKLHYMKWDKLDTNQLRRVIEATEGKPARP